MLSPVLAQQIAAETSEAIGHNVIITDADAVVIGSGDESRVGSLHEASLEVMKTQESAWHNPEQARLLRGVRPGITLPLLIDGDAVGTVGITGSPRQVRRFGLLVRRQTEILLEESALVRSRLLRERALGDLVVEVTGFAAGSSDPDLLQASARELGFTLTIPRRALVVQTIAAPIGPEVLRAVRAVFHHRQDMVARRSTSTCLVLLHEDARSAADEATRLVSVLEERFTCEVHVGISEVTEGIESLADACRDAADALVLGGRVHRGHSVVPIARVRTHQALMSLPPRERTRLTVGTLGDLPDREDWSTLRTTVLAWCESGFNLVEAASKLTVHRNTLLYRLGKLEQLSGRPWRDHQGMLAVYVACLADQATAGDALKRSTP